MLDMIQVGAISSTHGLKGEVYIYLTSDDPYRFDNLKEVLLDLGSSKRPLSVEYVKYFKGRPIVKFREFNFKTFKYIKYRYNNKNIS